MWTTLQCLTISSHPNMFFACATCAWDGCVPPIGIGHAMSRPLAMGGGEGLPQKNIIPLNLWKILSQFEKSSPPPKKVLVMGLAMSCHYA